MNQIPNIEEEKGMERILDVLPHLILGNAEELYNNPDGEMAKNTISEMQRVIRETHHHQLQKAREEERVQIANALVDALPTGTLDAFEIIKAVKKFQESLLTHSELDQDNK